MKKLVTILLLISFTTSYSQIRKVMFKLRGCDTCSLTSINDLHPSFWHDADHYSVPSSQVFSDRSVNGNDYTSSPGHDGTLNTSALNGHNTFTFTTSPATAFTLTTPIASATDFTYIIVYKKRTTGVYFFGLNSAGNGEPTMFEDDPGNTYVVPNTTYSGAHYIVASGESTSWTYLTSSATSTTVALWKNGSSIGTFSSGAGAATGSYTGIGNIAGGLYNDGDFAADVFFPYVLTTTQRIWVENQLKNYYGL